MTLWVFHCWCCHSLIWFIFTTNHQYIAHSAIYFKIMRSANTHADSLKTPCVLHHTKERKNLPMSLVTCVIGRWTNNRVLCICLFFKMCHEEEEPGNAIVSMYLNYWTKNLCRQRDINGNCCEQTVDGNIEWRGQYRKLKNTQNFLNFLQTNS